MRRRLPGTGSRHGSRTHLWDAVEAAAAAATATGPAPSSDAPRTGGAPGDGSGAGACFEQFAHEPELWLDWAADTGDGFHPTYAVCRALAQPALEVEREVAGGARDPFARALRSTKPAKVNRRGRERGRRELSARGDG